MRFMICGLGSIGRRHLRNLVRLGQEDIVLYRTGKSTLPDDEVADFPTEHDLGAALERWQPGAVLVTNPTALHLDVALPAAKSGAHLFLEKPVSDSMEGVAALQEEIRNGGLRVLVGFQFRFHPGLRRAKSLLEQGQIGTPLAAVAHWGEYLPDWHPWEDYRQGYSAREDLGGGVVLTLSHPLDYLRWLLGEVVSVRGEMRRSEALDTQVEDTAQIILEHESGTLSSVHLNYHQRPMRHDLEIVGSAGTLRWDAVENEVSWWNPDDERWQTEAAPKRFERNSMFVDEMSHFLDVVRGEAQPVCDLEDGIAALRIALAALDSARDGQRLDLRERV